MKFINNGGVTDPRVNLALEEYVLKSLPAEESYLLFYMNEPSIIIGKNQHTAAEINQDYVERNGIHVVRRLSGGGAVYHDLGNLNFSFITDDDGKSFLDFRQFTEPVVSALRQLGVDVQLTGRNDIQVGERKISGNAQYAAKGRMFHHGTLLFSSELEHVVNALKVNQEKIQSKGIQSIRSRVANISEFLTTPLTMNEFRLHLLHSIFAGKAVPEYNLTSADWEQVQALSKERYQNWEWNYGKSPAGNFRNIRRLPVGTVEVHLDIGKGRIRNAKIHGDFFGMHDVRELEEQLIGIPYEKTPVLRLLGQLDVTRYFGATDAETIAGVFFDN